MPAALPPGPRMPRLLQTVAWWSRPIAFQERCRARYGKRFTVRLLGQSPFVMLSDPDEIKQIFQAPPDVLHPGEGAYVLEPVVGRYSVILLDEDPHIEQRKLLLPAFHDDGSPMGRQELRDELMTALVAGHETTASQLAWAVDRLGRAPAVQRRLHEELSNGEDEAYLTATIQEILRHKPVLPNPEPRLVKKPIEIGGVSYQPGAVLFAGAYLVQHDPDIYPDPYAFRPERFLDQPPGTYTWIPFGGGRRRCIGAAFAQLEMKLVLRALLQSCELAPAS